MSNQTTIVGVTDIGRARLRNEDSYALLPVRGVAVVADGMGGHPGGDVASRIAADVAVRALDTWLPGDADRNGAPDMAGAMRRSVLAAHEAIRVEGESLPELDGMGTTLTAMVVDADTDGYALGHVGDSRAYRLRDGRLTLLTRDDTWVQERVEAAELTEEQARRHPFGHILTQCLGLADTPTPHVSEGSVEPGDVYLLCTDGLVGMLEDAEVERILTEHLDGTDAEEAARALIEAANEAGGYDNITVALLVVTRGD